MEGGGGWGKAAGHGGVGGFGVRCAVCGEGWVVVEEGEVVVIAAGVGGVAVVGTSRERRG